MRKRLNKIKKWLLKFASEGYNSNNLRMQIKYEPFSQTLYCNFIDSSVKSWLRITTIFDNIKFEYSTSKKYFLVINYNTNWFSEINIKDSQKTVDSKVIDKHLKTIEQAILNELPTFKEFEKRKQAKNLQYKQAMKNIRKGLL